MDCSSKIHRIDPSVDSVIRFLDSFEYSQSARITSLSALKSRHVPGKTAYNRLPCRFRINMKSSASKGMQILSLRRCNLRSSTLTKEAVLSESFSSLVSANSSSLRSSMVKGDRPSMACTRDRRLMFKYFLVHDYLMIILRSWDVMGTSAYSKMVFSIMYFCTIIIMYGSVFPCMSITVTTQVGLPVSLCWPCHVFVVK